MKLEAKTPTLQGCAHLFSAVKRLLQMRAEIAGATKVLDSDVGAWIGLDPTDTSNWKNGKKAITRFSQYLRLASATGSGVEYLYAVATEQMSPDARGAAQAPMVVLVPEVEPVGSILLFFFVKEHMAELSAKIRDGQVGAVLGFAPTETTRWKRGSRTVSKIDQFMKLAALTDTSPLYLYQIASGELVPEHLKRYVFRAEKAVKSRKPPKRRADKIEQSA